MKNDILVSFTRIESTISTDGIVKLIYRMNEISTQQLEQYITHT